MDPKKVRRLRKLVETIVRRELLEPIGENEDKKNKKESGSSASTRALINFMKTSSTVSQKLRSITNDAHKARLIVDFAALVGIPKSKLNAIVSQMKGLSR